MTSSTSAFRTAPSTARSTNGSAYAWCDYITVCGASGTKQTHEGLRKQWSQEIEEKSFLPTIILEARNYNKMSKDGARRPFDRKSSDDNNRREAKVGTPRWGLAEF
jgi:hypothetical protein